MEKTHFVAGGAIAFADADCTVRGREGIDVGGWEGHEDYVTGETAVAGAVIGFPGGGSRS